MLAFLLLVALPAMQQVHAQRASAWDITADNKDDAMKQTVGGASSGGGSSWQPSVDDMFLG